jgi:hypothetical protein
MAELAKALIKFTELINAGYIVPAVDRPNLKPLSVYRSVPSILTGGSGTGRYSVGGTNAEFLGPSQGDKRNAE